MEGQQAAKMIQKYFRGYLARKEYARKLLQLFLKEEAERREKERLQVWEGEILLERHHILHTISDNRTLSENESRKLNTMAIRIQQAWRRMKTSESQQSRWRTEMITESTAYVTPFVHSPGDNKNVNEDSLFANTCASKDDESDGSAISLTLSRKTSQSSSFSNSIHSQTSLLCDDSLSALNVEKQNCFEQQQDRNMDAGVIDTADGDNNHEIQYHANNTTMNPSSACIGTIDAKVLQTPDLHIGYHPTTSEPDGTMKQKTAMYTSHAASIDVALEPREFPFSESGDIADVTGNRYRLCYTLELSDSSSEDMDGREVVSFSMESRSSSSLQPDKSELDTNVVHVHAPLQQLDFSFVSLTNDLEQTRSPDNSFELYEDPLQNLSYAQIEQNDPAESTVYEQSLEDEDTVSVTHSTGPLHKSHSYCHNHSESPLHGMSLQQLAQLVHLLESKLKGLSKALVGHLEERESLRNQNNVLHVNIAQLTRRIQQMYTPG